MASANAQQGLKIERFNSSAIKFLNPKLILKNMTLRKPTATDKLAYFTRRTIGDKGKVMMWRFEGDDLTNLEYVCPHCCKTGEKRVQFERQKTTVKDKETGKSKRKNAFIFKCEHCEKDIVLEQWVKKGPGRKSSD